MLSFLFCLIFVRMVALLSIFLLGLSLLSSLKWWVSLAAVRGLTRTVWASYQRSAVQSQPTASRLLPPASCLPSCVAVCHSGRAHSHKKHPALHKASCCRFGVPSVVSQHLRAQRTKPKGFPIFFVSGDGAPRVAELTGDNKRKAPGDKTR